MELLATALTSDNVKLKQETLPDLGRTILRMPLTANAIAFGNDGIIQVFSAGATMLTGYGEQEVIGRYTPELVHDTAEIKQRGAELAKLFGRPVVGFRVLVEMADAEGYEMRIRTLVRKDFTKVRVREWVERLSGPNGECIGYIMLIQPEPEDGMKSDGKLVHHKNRLLFLGDLAHAIRTPMNSVLGYATLLKESSSDQAQIAGLDKILENGNALMRYVDDALEWAELEGSDLPAQPSPLELGSLVVDLQGNLDTELRRKSIRLTWDVRPMHPREFRTDVRRFSKVLGQLLRLAVDRTPTGWIHLQFAQEPEDGSALWVRLSAPPLPVPVRKYGDGAASGRNSSLNDSTGLLRALGGTIEISPGPEGIEPFFARLRIRGVYNDGLAGNFVSPAKFALPAGISVLLVDPYSANRDLLRFCFKSLGYVSNPGSGENEMVRWVAGLSESVSQVKCWEPDLILVSIDVLNGIEPPLVWNDRKPGPHKKALVVGCVRPDQSGLCNQGRLDGLLVMPFHPAAVGRMISQLNSCV